MPRGWVPHVKKAVIARRYQPVLVRAKVEGSDLALALPVGTKVC